MSKGLDFRIIIILVSWGEYDAKKVCIYYTVDCNGQLLYINFFGSIGHILK